VTTRRIMRHKEESGCSRAGSPMTDDAAGPVRAARRKAMAGGARSSARSRAAAALVLAAVALCFMPDGAGARPARCSTTDDGSYACDFQAIGKDGSFTISAPGKPTFVVTVTSPGIASGSVDFGDRAVALPGRYMRSSGEPGCWVSESTGTRICAQGAAGAAARRR
jgi:hypothetical protein